MTTTSYKPAGLLTEDQKELLEKLMDGAKKIRASYKYSEDEQMNPTAFIVKPDTGLEMMVLLWKDNKEKYLMAGPLHRRPERYRGVD